MTAPTASCPSCAGPHMVDHPAGVLEFQHRITCALLVYEDATRAADEQFSTTREFRREVTMAERLLIDTLGLEPPAGNTIIVT